MLIQPSSLILVALAALVSITNAAPASIFQPNLTQDELVTEKIKNELRLIKTSASAPAKWMNDDQIQALYDKHIKFVDVTFTPNLRKNAVKSLLTEEAIPTVVTQQSVVKPIIEKASTDLMKTALTEFTKFNNRYYRSSTGAQSGNWLFEQVKTVAAKATQKITVTQFKHSWGQASIIARIEGLNNNQETVIVGAHQDSINMMDRMKGRAPGADDDGSGSVTVLEAFHLIVESGYQGLRPVEFHWYSGEEAGLLGSQAIAADYQKNKRVVAGMMQLDMTGFPTKSKPDVGIVTDNTNSSLNTLVAKLVGEYTALPVGKFRCGYGCSDHASWNDAGYPSTIPFESSNMDENDNIHTPQDSLDTIDFDHMLNFAKVAVGFIVELSHQ